MQAIRKSYKINNKNAGKTVCNIEHQALFDSQKSFQIPLEHVLKIVMHNFEPHITLAPVF